MIRIALFLAASKNTTHVLLVHSQVVVTALIPLMDLSVTALKEIA